MIFQDESSDIDTELFVLEKCGERRFTIGEALISPLFIQEREEPANLIQVYHSHEESLLPAQSFSVCHSRTGRPVHELSSPGSCIRESPSRDSENEEIRILLERWQKSEFSLFVEQRFKNTSSKQILMGEVSRNWMEFSSVNEVRKIALWQVMNNFDDINYYFKNKYQNKIWIFVKLI